MSQKSKICKHCVWRRTAWRHIHHDKMTAKTGTGPDRAWVLAHRPALCAPFATLPITVRTYGSQRCVVFNHVPVRRRRYRDTRAIRSPVRLLWSRTEPIRSCALRRYGGLSFPDQFAWRRDHLRLSGLSAGSCRSPSQPGFCQPPARTPLVPGNRYNTARFRHPRGCNIECRCEDTGDGLSITVVICLHSPANDFFSCHLVSFLIPPVETRVRHHMASRIAIMTQNRAIAEPFLHGPGTGRTLGLRGTPVAIRHADRLALPVGAAAFGVFAKLGRARFLAVLVRVLFVLAAHIQPDRRAWHVKVDP